ncbi:pimeloyl-ACP methyl ester carboxylesterase [Lentimicrobium saccharophilum]|uniref:Pimeloyl-ACP methyl ester carboxylesterase n=2 Tax=Lentimicrobium saccharophilum TaxID=1678841 RepID=A0A0S7BZW4_9BACT|nr:pimeloyl-ACP methyl ester carboxylesterase [Lentimicrobium saccharophilum]
MLLSISRLYAQDSPFPDKSELEGKNSGDFVIKSGTIYKNKADFGLILVPESRSNPQSRPITIPFIRHYARNDSIEKPIFLLGGGPGKSNLWTEMPEVFYTHNDVINVGYRGVDGDIKLKCKGIGEAMTINNPLSPASLITMRKTLRGTYDSLLQESIDLNGYNMLEVVDDIEAVRNALGYEDFNLFSTSYGTQVAYIACLRYPQYIHRNLMIGASNRERLLLGWEPEMVDKMLNNYNTLWKSDSEAVLKSPDILITIKKVFQTLPIEWQNIRIDPDKLKLASFYLLYETETAAALFDAYVAAEKGDYSGLALISLGYDETVIDTSRQYWGDFINKVVSGGLDTTKSYDSEPTGSIFGSPSRKFWWNSTSLGGWPVNQIPTEFRQLDTIKAKTLIINGELDFSSPPDYIMELNPYLSNGKIVIIPSMGHMEVVYNQREGFEHLVDKFYRNGIVDTSKYIPKKIDFTPAETFQDEAKRLFQNEIK